MKRFRTSLAAKTAAVLLALAVGAGGFWSTVFILYQWDTLWLGSGYYDSNDYYSDLYNRSSRSRAGPAAPEPGVERRPALPGPAAAGHAGGGPLPGADQLRFAIRRNDTGTLVYSNLEGRPPWTRAFTPWSRRSSPSPRTGLPASRIMWSGTVRSSTTSSISPFPTPLAPSSSSPRRMPGSPPNTATPLTAIPGTMTSRWTAG
ncbi:MAG: hypothetical protein ACLRIS_10740 [Flavonifractor plautii]